MLVRERTVSALDHDWSAPALPCRPKALRCRRCGFGPLCLPAGVQPSEVALLDGVVDTRRTVEEGEALVRAGDPLRALYMLRSGSMKSEARCGGRVQVLGFHLPGEVAGWDGLATGRHRCDLVALERTSGAAVGGRPP